MTLTAHGHHIPRTGHNDEVKGIKPRYCGGVGVCGSCTMEAKALYMKKYPEDFVPEI